MRSTSLIKSGIVVALTGLIVEIPMYTIIAVIKSPYMLFKGWQRLLHDLLSGEGPFLETACVPIAGLAIILWPLAVVGSILMAFLSSIFIGLYGAVIVYQERSFRRGLAYVVAMVAAFDEYTNDWLYLSEGSIFPRPQYRKRKASNSTELSVGPSTAGGGKFSSAPLDPPALLVPSLLPSRSVREAIQEVKMVQIWEELMMACEIGGKLFVDAHVITSADLNEWFKAKGNNQNGILDLGLPSYCLLDTIVFSMKAGSGGIVLSNGVEVNYLNRPQGKLFDWFFHPVMVLKEQIKAINMEEGEMRFLEKLVLLGSNTQRMQAWENGSVVPEDALRTAQIQGISRRLVGMAGSISKFPTYRRRFRHVMKVLLTHSFQKETSHISQLDRMERGSFRALGSLRGSRSVKPSSSIEAIHSEV
uniref:Putative membrane protein At3g27390 n=1 Tax=Anthurium amnicola TaxID=1678845 RepID=A0A1D1XI34_9ARAE